MDPKDLNKELSSLAQLDIDAIHAYDQAIHNIDVTSVREQLTQFKADHERHVRDLSVIIQRFGGQAPSFSPDFKGYVLQGFTALRSAMGTEGALKAMKGNEELTNRTYSNALGKGFPVDVLAVLQKNYADEQRHLAAINQWIGIRVWEQAGAGVHI
ncbi:MAG TPA: DUF2383 domain-containing protein [Myxococcales bacterium]